MHEWLQRSNVILKGRGLEESPHCYQRLDEVLAVHGNTIHILHTVNLGLVASGADLSKSFRKPRVWRRRVDVARPLDGERRAFAGLRLNVNRAAVFIDDVLHRPEPHAVALRALGSLTELEDGRQQ